MPTLTEILADIDLRYPNTLTDTQKVYFINRILPKYYKYAPLEVATEITLSTGVGSYLSSADSGFRFENLIRLEMYDTTATIASSDREEYTLYPKQGTNEARAIEHVYDSSGALGIFPTPSTSNSLPGKHAIVYFYKFPAVASTTASSAIPDMDENYQEIIVHAAISMIAKSGINPDIDIANNAQADLSELLKEARMERARRRYKRHQKNQISYKEGWDAGGDFGISSSS